MSEYFHYIKWFQDIGIEDIAVVGGKNASLGEMYRGLKAQGVHVPNGFALTVDAFQYFLEAHKLGPFIEGVLFKLNTDDVASLHHCGLEIRQEILRHEMPQELQVEILRAYHVLTAEDRQSRSVAVRSSATAEDLPTASFAGQLESYLNVEGGAGLLDACIKCFASAFTDRVMLYRKTVAKQLHQVALSVGVQHMVRSDMATSGVMFTIDTETGFRDLVIINGSYGLGEHIVKGTVSPDEFAVFKPTLMKGYHPIVRRSLGSKKSKLIYDHLQCGAVQDVPVSLDDQRRFCLSDLEVLQLAAWGQLIEDYYSKKRGCPTPMDIEWAKDGFTSKIYIVQARPETVQAKRNIEELEEYILKEHGERLLAGKSVGQKISSGPVRIIEDVKNLGLLQEGEVLVTDKTDPDWEPIMKRAGAIVTNHGGRTCHAAIVSRELGITALVGTEHGTHILKDGEVVTVSCAEGELGYVYKGKLDFDIKTTLVRDIAQTKTKIMLNIGDVSQALKYSFLPNDGVGLVRIEFIIASLIGIHPMALVRYKTLPQAIQKTIDEKTAGYVDKPQFFVDKLAEGIGMIAAAFYPKDVIVRFSDFKTNEYANLVGGAAFEPKEENPMLGFRGACRYYSPQYKDGFALECQAILRVRKDMGLSNVKVMVPFCRTIDEGKLVIKQMSASGLDRGQDGLEVYVMCEVPSNVIQSEGFSEVFDGMSIGSNDLTQLILGIDRSSEQLSSLFNERHDAVKQMIKHVIATSKKLKKKVGICGQAPSDYPEFVQFLVEQGIDSISLNPDAVMNTRTLVASLEMKK